MDGVKVSRGWARLQQPTARALVPVSWPAEDLQPVQQQLQGHAPPVDSRATRFRARERTNPEWRPAAWQPEAQAVKATLAISQRLQGVVVAALKAVGGWGVLERYWALLGLPSSQLLPLRRVKWREGTTGALLALFGE